ncbi:spore germination protein [Halobacillus litoralis]|uniref:spore germination protein n=1 Tax=Halobacillus litoralis TaxID=45668 RepID=UPI001CFE30E3|nr:spore germination protein [Halobacillus litoralis]
MEKSRLDINEILREKSKQGHIVTKEIEISGHSIYVIYMPSITKNAEINNSILSPLMEWKYRKGQTPVHTFSTEQLQVMKNKDELDAHLLDGYTILIENEDVYALDTAYFSHRSISEPVSEMTLRGSRDGFIESIQENINLLRVHLRTTDLQLEYYTVGTKSFTNVILAYIQGEVNEELLKEARKRIEEINAEYVSDGGLIEQSIEKNTYSLFPEVQGTERPIKVTNALVEGKVAIFVDGSPTVLIAPITLNSLFQTSDDYSFKWIPASLVRLMRYIAAFLAVMLPSIYISLISYHHGLIPTDLAISISKTREGVPIPSFMEAFLMQVTIEVLREAGIRLPKPIGPAVSIVGAIVLGEAAVTAGIVSPLMVIVVSFAAICSFTIPDYSLSLALRAISFIMLFAAAILGIYGLIIAIFLLSIHLVRIKSFSVPYLEPFAPYYYKRWKDTFIRFRFKKGGSQ